MVYHLWVDHPYDALDCHSIVVGEKPDQCDLGAWIRIRFRSRRRVTIQAGTEPKRSAARIPSSASLVLSSPDSPKKDLASTANM